jgi:hypothetical protein
MQFGCIQVECSKMQRAEIGSYLEKVKTLDQLGSIAQVWKKSQHPKNIFWPSNEILRFVTTQCWMCLYVCGQNNGLRCDVRTILHDWPIVISLVGITVLSLLIATMIIAPWSTIESIIVHGIMGAKFRFTKRHKQFVWIQHGDCI